MKVFDKLNGTQKDLLGWLAFHVNSLDNNVFDEMNSKMSSSWHDMMMGKIRECERKIDVLVTACEMVGIDNSCLTMVLDNKVFTGLRNYNKLSGVEYYK